MKARVIALFVCTLLAIWLIAPAVPGYADTVIRTNGRRIKGKIVEETDDYVKVKTKYGEVTIDQDDVMRIIRDPKEPTEEGEKAVAGTKEKRYQTRLKRAEREDRADAFHNLGQWCEKEGLEKEAKEAYEKALELNPYYAPAHRALGHVRAGSKWMPEEEAVAKGYVKNEKGKWVNKESLNEKEKKKLEAERLRADKYEKEKAKEYQGVPWAKRHIIKTEHYDIHCNSTREIAERYAKIMEALYAKNMQVFKALKPESRRSKVFIHRNQKEFMEMNNRSSNAGGFFRPDTRDLTSYHGSFGVTGTTLTVLAHEGCHQFQALFVRGDVFQFMAMPIWLLEGMAVIFEAAEIKRSGKVKLVGPSPDRVKQLQQMIKDEEHITLRKMMDTPKRQFDGRYYNSAGTFTWWLLKASKKKKYLKLYEEYLLKCVKRAQDGGGRRGMQQGGRGMRPGMSAAESGPFEEIAEEIAGKNLDELEEEWCKYVLKIKVPKLGRFSRDTFKSKELAFEISRPSKKWQNVKESELSAGYIVRFQIPIPGAKKNDYDKALARFEVVSFGNGLGGTADEALAEWERNMLRNVERSKRQRDSSKHLSDFKVFDKKKIVISGYDAAMFEYTIKNPAYKWNKNILKVRWITIYTTERIYMLFGTAQADKFDEYKDDFQKMIDSMVIKLK